VSTGLLALLDDIAALAKVAATALDDAAAQAVKAGGKAAGIVIDDAAVTPRYVVGFTSDRELPIIGKIALGSLKNKFLFLLPGALILSLVAPWLITPLLMFGGAFLCLEGYHKVHDLVTHHAHDDAAEAEGVALLTAKELEDSKVSSAIRTDIILSAEIMAISLATVSDAPLWMQAVTLAIVGLGMTVIVYGAVALIVRADDMGAALARSRTAPLRAIGRGVVLGMPGFLKALSLVGTLAMLWVGGGILVHGLAGLGYPGLELAIHDVAHAVGVLIPAIEGVLTWFVNATLSGLLGLVVGWVVDLFVVHALTPVLAKIRPKRAPTAHVIAADAATGPADWNGPG
jgi:predicted DNA repair protein MutK